MLINWLKRTLNKIKKHFSKSFIKKYTFNKVSKKDKIILVYRIDLIGDYVISKDFLRLLRACPNFKGYKIVFLGNIALTDFIIDFDKEYIDEYITFTPSLFKYSKYKNALIKIINKYNYEYVLNYMSIRNEWSEFIIANVDTGRKIGIKGLSINLSKDVKDKYDKMYNELYDVNNSYSQCGLELLNQVTGVDNGKYIHSYKFCADKLRYFELKYKSPYAIIFPSASTPNKRMPFKKFLELSNYLHDKYKLKIYICGNKADKEIFKDFNIDRTYITDLCGVLKLSELPYLFKNAKIVLTNDTCAMWIANCTNTKSIVFSNVHNFDIKGLKRVNFGSENFYEYYCGENIRYILPEPAYEQILNNGTCESNIPLDYVNIKNAKYNIDKSIAIEN